MAESVINLGENSTEYVAYRLLQDIMRLERKTILTGSLKEGWSTADRSYVLDTYHECLRTVRGLR